MRLVVAALAVLIALAACSTADPVAPVASGISRDDAIRIAQQHAGSSAQVTSVTAGTSAGWVSQQETAAPAWIVTFQGTFPMECPAGEPSEPCPNLHSAVVVIDAATGRFVAADYE